MIGRDSYDAAIQSCLDLKLARVVETHERSFEQENMSALNDAPTGLWGRHNNVDSPDKSDARSA